MPRAAKGKNMKYFVNCEVWGYISVEVDAKDYEEAKDIACEVVSNMDFGSLENIEWAAKSAENENGEDTRYR